MPLKLFETLEKFIIDTFWHRREAQLCTTGNTKLENFF